MNDIVKPKPPPSTKKPVDVNDFFKAIAFLQHANGWSVESYINGDNKVFLIRLFIEEDDELKGGAGRAETMAQAAELAINDANTGGPVFLMHKDLMSPPSGADDPT